MRNDYRGAPELPAEVRLLLAQLPQVKQHGADQRAKNREQEDLGADFLVLDQYRALVVEAVAHGGLEVPG